MSPAPPREWTVTGKKINLVFEGFLKEQNTVKKFRLHKIQHGQTLIEGPSFDGQKTANKAIGSFKRLIRSSELDRGEIRGEKQESIPWFFCEKREIREMGTI